MKWQTSNLIELYTALKRRDKIQIKNIKKLSFDFCSPRKTLSIEKNSESYVTSITSIFEKKFRCTDQLVISSNLTQRKREGQVSRCYPLIFFSESLCWFLKLAFARICV